VPGADLGDDPGRDDQPDARDRAFGDDDVVELQISLRGERDGELQRGRVLGAGDAPDGNPAAGVSPACTGSSRASVTVLLVLRLPLGEERSVPR
jgi:hypothetical protein